MEPIGSGIRVKRMNGLEHKNTGRCVGSGIIESGRRSVAENKILDKNVVDYNFLIWYDKRDASVPFVSKSTSALRTNEQPRQKVLAPKTGAIKLPYKTKYADVAELADAPVLGAGTSVCRFDPCRPHHN